MKVMLPPEERKALKEFLDAALTRSDASSVVPRVIPSETLFMLMLVHLKAKVDSLEERAKERTANPRICSDTSTATPELEGSESASSEGWSRQILNRVVRRRSSWLLH